MRTVAHVNPLLTVIYEHECDIKIPRIRSIVLNYDTSIYLTPSL